MWIIKYQRIFPWSISRNNFSTSISFFHPLKNLICHNLLINQSIRLCFLNCSLYIRFYFRDPKVISTTFLAIKSLEKRRGKGRKIFISFHCIIWLKNCFRIELLSPISGAKTFNISNFPITCCSFPHSTAATSSLRETARFVFMCKKLYFLCRFSEDGKKNEMKKQHELQIPMCIEEAHRGKKHYFRFVEQSAKRVENIIEIILLLPCFCLPQKLEIINCHFYASDLPIHSPQPQQRGAEKTQSKRQIQSSNKTFST